LNRVFEQKDEIPRGKRGTAPLAGDWETPAWILLLVTIRGVAKEKGRVHNTLKDEEPGFAQLDAGVETEEGLRVRLPAISASWPWQICRGAHKPGKKGEGKKERPVKDTWVVQRSDLQSFIPGNGGKGWKWRVLLTDLHG